MCSHVIYFVLGPKKVLKSERPAVLKSSAYLRRKHMNSSLGKNLFSEL